MKIKIKNLLPNPYRNIDTYPIDQEKIRQLRNSIRETTFWDNILARPYNGKYQIAYGHHRLIAIKEELGENIIVDIPVRDLSDEDMLKIMANENMQEWSTDWRIIIETVKQAKKFLEKNTEVAKKYGAKNVSDVGYVTISKFLGRNWGTDTIERGLKFLKDKELKSITIEGHGDIEKIGHRIIGQIISVKDKETKKLWLERIKDKDISYLEAEEIRRFENEPALSDYDKQTIRTLIQKGEIRGQEQIARTVQVYKTQRLYMPKTSPEKEKKRKELGKHLLDIARDAKHLANLITALSGQLINYPETIELFPPEEAQQANQALQDLFTAIAEFKQIYNKARKPDKKLKALEVKHV